MNKIIITAALNGAGTTKEQTPHVPTTPDEIAKDVVDVVKMGASIVHLHARDEQGINTMDTDKFVEIVEKSKAACKEAGLDVIFNLTSSGGQFPYELRKAHLKKIKPEMCSLTPNTMNWANGRVFLNEPSFIEELCKLTLENDIKPEIEIFDLSMIESAKYYMRKGLLKTPCHFQFVLNVSIPGTIDNLAYLLPQLPKDSTWSVTGIGKSHLPMMLAGLSANCTVLRVGLEDNILQSKGVLATNTSLVERAVALAKLAGREIAAPDEAREILSIKRKW